MALDFDIRKYKHDGKITSTNLAGASYHLVDGSDSLANQVGQVISFQNVRNDKDVFFKAFITAFNETYSPNFNPTEVFGRTDPIYQYKNTTRNITLAFKIPAASESEAFENLGRVQKLLQMLYPSYKKVNEEDNALTLSKAPLVRLKVMNLLTKNEKVTTEPQGDGGSPYEAELFTSYKSSNESARGLLGVITSCTINHNLEGTDGVFQRIRDDNFGVPKDPVSNTILPKLIDVSISFSPLHEQTLGYDTNNEASFALFPYGVELGASKREDKAVQPSAKSQTSNTAAQSEPGKSLSDLRRLKKTLEEKRRKAASAQQAADKAQAKWERVNRRMTRKQGRGDGELTEKQQERWSDAAHTSISADRRVETAQAQVAEIEGLIG